MSLKRIIEPATEPITLAEAKAHLRISHDAEDDLISALIASARDLCEQETGRALLPQTWRKTYDNFPDVIELAILPVISVSSFEYTDANGEDYALLPVGYALDNASNDRSAWLVPAAGYRWPYTYQGINGVRVEFISGYANAASVPAALRQWMLLQIGHWHKNRESVADWQTSKLQYVDGLLNPYKVWSL
jgi:uncharacterized phiE125 gp8 family phage protein